MSEAVAVLIRDKNKFVICHRPPHKVRGFLWEFVGGKVELQRTAAQSRALRGVSNHSECGRGIHGCNP